MKSAAARKPRLLSRCVLTVCTVPLCLRFQAAVCRCHSSRKSTVHALALAFFGTTKAFLLLKLVFATCVNKYCFNNGLLQWNYFCKTGNNIIISLSNSDSVVAQNTFNAKNVFFIHNMSYIQKKKLQCCRLMMQPSLICDDVPKQN